MLLVARCFTPGIRLHETEPARAMFYKTAKDYQEAARIDSRLPMAQFIECPTIGDFGYRNVLQYLFSQKVDLIIVEQDLILEVFHIRSLFFCRYHQICAWAYSIYPVSTSWTRPLIAHRVEDEDREVEPPYRWITKDQSFADLVGLGLIRIKQEVLEKITARDLLEPFDKAHYTNCDTLMSLNMKKIIGQQWHIHWPEIEHKHV